MSEHLNISKIGSIVKRNSGWIVGIIVLCVFTMCMYLYYIATPIYQKSTQLLVNQSEKTERNIEAQTVQADLQLVNTYSSIISSPRILTKVKERLKEDYPIQSLAKMIQVKNTSNSQVIEIDVMNKNPKQATKIANLTAEVFTKDIPNLMKTNNVVVLSKATNLKKEQPIKPQKSSMLMISFFLGIIVAILFIGVKTLFERTFVSAKEVEEILGLLVLGEVSEDKAITTYHSARKG